jgi:4-hydroxy-tetrahydrodipicolinate synthase
MFHGSLVAIVTPMREAGEVDFDAWARLLDFHLENGTAGIVVGGTTGESATLSEAELRELTERACTHVKRRIPIVVGAGTSSTAATVARVRWLSELPIDGLLIVTPA